MLGWEGSLLDMAFGLAVPDQTRPGQAWQRQGRTDSTVSCSSYSNMACNSRSACRGIPLLAGSSTTPVRDAPWGGGAAVGELARANPGAYNSGCPTSKGQGPIFLSHAFYTVSYFTCQT